MSREAVTDPAHTARGDIFFLETHNGIELSISGRKEKTPGSVIAKPVSCDLIDGARIEHGRPAAFFEFARLGKGLSGGFVPQGNRKIHVS